MKFSYSTTPAASSTSQPNQPITLRELEQLVNAPPPTGYDKLPELTGRSIAGDKSAKAQATAIKSALPWFIPGGTCESGHNNATLQYNGCLQIDFDDKAPGGDIRAAELLQRAAGLPGVLMAARSPTGYGLKMLVATTNTDKEKHGKVLAAAIQFFAEVLDVDPGKFDKLPASQPCYIPYNRQGQPGAYFNHDSQPLALNIQSEPTKRSRAAEQQNCPTDKALDAVNYLITSGADVANGYDDYLRLHAACINAFGHEAGEQIAFDLLNNSAAFRASDYSKQFRQKQKSLKERVNGKRATGWTLVGLAIKQGWFYEPHSTAQTITIQAEPGEYVLSAMKRYRAEIEIYGKIFIAGTGTGKTTAACELAEINKRKHIIAVPTIAILIQLLHKYKNAVGFYKNNHQLPANAELIITTPQSLHKLETRVNIAEYDIFLDEAHELATATRPGFKLEALQRVIDIAERARTFTLMTGTPLYHNIAPLLRDKPRLEYKQHHDTVVKRSVQFWQSDNTLVAVSEAVRGSIKEGGVPVVLLNDKKGKLDTLQALLEGVNVLPVNADTKEDPDVSTLLKTGAIPEGMQAFICTAVVQTGNSFHDTRRFDYITAGLFHAVELAQATARPRKATEVRLVIIRSNNRKPGKGAINPAALFRLFQENALITCQRFNNRAQLEDRTAAFFFENKIRSAIQHDCIKQTKAGYIPDDLAIMNRVFEAEKQAQSASDELLAQALKKYGFNIEGEARVNNGGALAKEIPAKNTELSAETAERVKAFRDSRKQEREKKYRADLQALADAPNAGLMLREIEKASKLTTAQKRVKALTGSYCLPPETAVKLLQDEESSGQAFSHLCKELAADRLQSSADYMALSTILSKQIQALRFVFNEKRAMTATDARLALLPVLKLDNTLDLSKFEPDESDTEAVNKANRAALQFIRIFYDVNSAGKPGSRACPRKSVFFLNKKAKFRGHALPELRDARLRDAYEKALRPAFAA